MAKMFPLSRGRRLLAFATVASPLFFAAASAYAMTHGQIATETRTATVVEGDDIAFSRVENTEDFSQSRIGQVAQDDMGFMWFGTQYGLYRFDGYSHTVFAADRQVDNQLSGVFVHAIYNDRSGRLWISTDQGVDIFDPRLGKFNRITYAGKAHPTVQSFYQDRSGTMWLSTTEGLYGVDQNGTPRSHFRSDARDPDSLASNDLKFAKEDRKGTFWVTGSAGLEAIDRTSGRVLAHIPLQEPRELNFVEDRAGLLWIFHAGGNGLSTFNRSTNTLSRYRFVDTDGKPLPRFGIFSALADRDGGLWFGTGGAGLLRLDADRGRFVRYRHSPSDSQSLSGDDIVTLFQDREDNIWVALHGEQLNFFSARKPSFMKLPPRPASVDVRAEKMVNSVLEVEGRALWISYMGMLLSADRDSGERQNLHRRYGLQADVISMAQDAKGRIWLGTVGTGLVAVDPSGRVLRFQHDPADSDSLANDVVNDILVDRSHNLWFATWGGLSRFDEESGRFDNYRPSGTDPKYLALAEDGDGKIWLGTHQYGLQRFDPRTNEFVTYPAKAGGVSNGRVNAVHVDRRGAVWAGTQNGLDVLDRATGRILTYRVDDGLPGNAVSCILEDAQGGIWLGTNNGLARLDASTRKIRSYARNDGLPGLDFTGWGACYQSPERKMYFAGFSGATAFYPDQVRTSGHSTLVEFTDLSIAGRRFPDSPLRSRPQVLPTLGELRLPYSQNSFSAGFSALNYTNPIAVAYRFRLVGLEDKWHVVDSARRVASYNSLPPGSYRLEVQAAASGGRWSGTKALELTILEPWWQSNWLHLLVALLGLGVVLLIYRLRVRQMMHRLEIRLDERVTERTRIARELHDSLLQGFHGLMFRLQAVRNLLPTRPQDAAIALEEALSRGDETVERAREAVTDLRTFGSSELDLEAALRAMVRDLPTSSREGAPQCGIEVEVEGTPRRMIPLVRDDVLQVAREALRNAVQHASAKRVKVEVHWGVERFSIRVLDDGVGLEPQLIAHGRQGHWGIHGMRERTRQVGGNLEIRSDDKGTLVELSIAAGGAYLRTG
jgi:ligand-binding sensor domain-containing protein/signal transduction histidine kinase